MLKLLTLQQHPAMAPEMAGRQHVELGMGDVLLPHIWPQVRQQGWQPVQHPVGRRWRRRRSGDGLIPRLLVGLGQPLGFAQHPLAARGGVGSPPFGAIALDRPPLSNPLPRMASPQ